MSTADLLTAADLFRMDNRELARVMATGHAIDLRALAETEYKGVSLGLPEVMDKILWKTFRKTFHRDPARGVLRGWNVRMEQTGLDGPRVPMRNRRGEEITFGHYHVLEAAGLSVCRGWDRGVLLDYQVAGNALTDPARFTRAPVVAVNPGSAELLLGWDYAKVGPLEVPTPAYWTLELEGPLSRVVQPPRA